MFQSLHIGRPFGINTYIHPTFWLLPAYVFLSGASSVGLEAASLDVAVLLAVFGCVGLHELGHALAAKGFGIRTLDIVLYPLGGVARLERMPTRPWKEIVVALAGPAVNVAIVALLAPLMLANSYTLEMFGPTQSFAESFWNRLLWGNAILFAFNLLPAFPMDGGRVLRALLASVMDRVTATNVASKLGAVFAGLFVLAGAISFNVMLVVLGIFLYMAGQAEARAVRQEASFEPRIPVVRPRRDGWVFDAERREWVEWRDGQPVRMIGV